MADISKIKLPDETEVNLKDAQAFANIENDGQGGSSYTITRRDGTTKQVTIPNVTTTDPGLMTASDKTKIDTIEQGAEVNQQAFSKIRVTKGSAHTDLDADTKTDTLELIEGDNVTLTPSAVSDAVTIHAKDTVYTLAQDATDGHIIILTNNDESSTDHVQTITIPDNNTTYSFAEGTTNKAFSVTPSGGSAQTVPIHGLGSASEKNFTTSVTSGSADLVTSGAVASAISTAIDNLPEPMIFKGTLGTNGTITSLPTASSSNEGWTYKVITAGTYASQAAKVGDMFVSAKIGSAYQWVYVPSGDDVEDTWRNIKVNGTEKLGTGISSGAVDFVDGDFINITYANNKITVSHADTSSQASVSNSGRTYIQSVTLDGAGHVTKLTSATETVVNTDTNVTQTATNTNANYEVLFSGTADNTTRTEGVRKYSNLIFNPSTGTLTTTKIVASTSTLGVADIDTANITEDNVGNLIVTGAARFLNTINGSISGNAATASDSDKLNGYASAEANTGNTIVKRTSNGYINATYFNQSSGAETPSSSSYIIYANSDGYFRKSTVANMKTAMSLNNVENKSSATIRGELTSANVTTALGYTPVNKAGDTITGRIAYSNVSMPLSAGKVTSLAVGTTEIFKDGIAISNPATSNDVGWMRVIGTGESDTVLEIATGDDGGGTTAETIVVRQYNTSNAIAHEAKLLDPSGNTSFPGSVTAPKFIGALQGNADTATSATSATKATQDGSGNVITSTYLKLSGGTMTGAITKSCAGGSWISQKDTTTTFLRITGESSASRWDSIMAGKDYDGNVWVLGRIQKEFGIAGYKAARTDNATDWYHRINTETGAVTFSQNVTATKFIGPLQGNADTATSATSATTATTATTTRLTTVRQASANLTASGVVGVSHFVATSSMTTGKPPVGDGHIIHMSWDNTGGWDAQLAVSANKNAKVAVRGQNNGTWGDWYPIGKFTQTTPTSGQVVITDGTTGEIKSSGYTIATSVPVNAKFTDTTYTIGVSGNSVTLTPSSGSAQSITVPYATNAGTASNLANFENNNSTGKNANNVTYNAHTYYTSNGPSTSIGASTNDGALYTQAYSTSWVGQIAQDYRNGNLFTRGKNNGTWKAWRKVAYTGDAPTAHNQSADTITSGYLNIQPENSPILIPFMNNDLAYMITRGGSTIVKYDGTTQSIDISGCFDAGPGYGYGISNSGDYTSIVMELTLHQTFTWTNTIYVDFGSSGWRAKDVEIEVMNINYSGDTWTSKYHNTSNTLGHCYVITSHTPSGASNAGGGFNKIRFTFKSFNSAQFRIAQLGLYNYGSGGLRTTYMSRGIDDAVWRSISPATTNKYNLGSSSLKWANVYATTFSGNLTGNVTGNVSGSSGLCTGNAATATKLQTARNIFNKSFDGSGNVAGQPLVYGSYNTTASSRYGTSGIQVRENDLVGNAQSDIAYAPAIGFHWANRIAATFLFHSDGNFYLRKQNFTDRATLDANLNGNAATATNVAWSGVTGKPSEFTPSSGSNYYVKSHRFSSQSTATKGEWVSMCNSTQTGSPTLPTTGKWWHVLSLDCWGCAPNNWTSQLAIATSDGNGVWWRRNDSNNTSIDSSTWHRLAEGDASGNATNANKVNNLTVQTAVPANAKFTDTDHTYELTSSNSSLVIATATSGNNTIWDVGVAKVNGHTVEKDVPSNAVFTDTKVTVTNTNPTSGTWYYPVWHTGTSGTSGLNANNGFRYYSLEGTTGAAGESYLQLGNSIATGTAGNKQGHLRIYGNNTRYAEINAPASASSNTAHTLPATGGTILNTGTTSFTQTLTSGTKIGEIKINGTSTDIFAPNPGLAAWPVGSIYISYYTSTSTRASGNPQTLFGGTWVEITNYFLQGRKSGSSYTNDGTINELGVATAGNLQALRVAIYRRTA